MELIIWIHTNQFFKPLCISSFFKSLHRATDVCLLTRSITVTIIQTLYANGNRNKISNSIKPKLICNHFPCEVKILCNIISFVLESALVNVWLMPWLPTTAVAYSETNKKSTANLFHARTCKSQWHEETFFVCVFCRAIYGFDSSKVRP